MQCTDVAIYIYYRILTNSLRFNYRQQYRQHQCGGRKAEENQILEAITALIDNRSESYNSLGIAGSYLAMENVEFCDATPLSEEELTEINAVVTNGDYAVLKDFPDYPYLIEKAYKIQMNYDGTENSKESYMLIVYANEQWELDICISALWEAYKLFLALKN